MTRLEGKTALITGGAGGIGRAIARRYRDEGATVIVGDVQGEGEPGIEFRSLDVTGLEAMRTVIDGVAADHGGIDIFVNNAAVFDMAPVVEITEASYDRVFAINVKGALFALQTVARSMIARGKGGKIINFASQAGRRGEGLVAVYCASKAAIISITQSAGLDLIRHGINVNAISPGVVDTPMWDEVDRMFARHEGLPVGEKKRQVGEAVPFGRMGRVEDMTGMAVFLAGAESDYIVGQTYNVDGGNVLS